MSRADRFIQLYNELSSLLEQRLAVENHLPFYKLVSQAAEKDRMIRRFEVRLRAFGDLRNAIVHDEKFPFEILAEPSESVVSELEQIVEEMRQPRRVYPAFGRNVRCFDPEDPLKLALRHMRDGDYSQVVVRDGGTLALLTNDGVSRWLENRIEDDVISIEEVVIRDILRFEEPGGFEVVGRDLTVHDAEALFAEAIAQGRPRLHALIITQSGRPSEAPLGIVTPWDLMESGKTRGERR